MGAFGPALSVSALSFDSGEEAVVVIWIALAFVVAMFVGFLVPKKPLKLNLNAPPKSPPKSSDEPKQ